MTVFAFYQDQKIFGRVEIDSKTQASLRKERARVIWQRLVRYVQADLNQKAELQNFGVLVEECMAWNGLVGIPQDVLGDKAGLFRTLASSRKPLTIKNMDPFKLCSDGLTPHEGAVKYQKDFLPVLKWLARNPELEKQARGLHGKEGAMFLRKHGDEEISIKIMIHTNTERSFYSQKVENYGTIAGPICRFILDRLNYYAEAADKSDIIPLKVCACCPKIMFFERNSRKTCSDSCRVAKHRKGL